MKISGNSDGLFNFRNTSILFEKNKNTYNVVKKKNSVTAPSQ